MKNIRQIERFCGRINQKHGIGMQKKTLYAIVGGLVGFAIGFMFIIL